MEEERGPYPVELIRGVPLAERNEPTHIIHTGDLKMKHYSVLAILFFITRMDRNGLS